MNSTSNPKPSLAAAHSRSAGISMQPHTTALLRTVYGKYHHVFQQWNCLAEAPRCIMSHTTVCIALLSLIVVSEAGAGCESRSRGQFYSPPPSGRWGMWRVARLMYLTQWKPRAEPMKTLFQGGRELSWFMASLLDGVQYLDCGRDIDNSSLYSPSPYAEQWSPAPDTPHSSLLSHCFIYSWLTCSWGSAPPFWGVEISSTGLYNFKWWQWLYW